jgi:hypothetical protein
VRRTEVALERLEEILAIELLMARDLLVAAREPHPLGVGAASVLESINSAIKDFGATSSAGQFHEAVRGVMRTHLLHAAGNGAGRLRWSS